MYASMTTNTPVQPDRKPSTQWGTTLLWGALLATILLFLPDLAQATGTGTTTGTGGAAGAQARITQVAVGWQNIVMGIGVAILIIAWAVIGYAISFGGKTMKDMQNPAIGTTVAGLAPVLVGWLFS